ncbi:MAG: hypothetical protein K8T89_16625, partial [Planctomycetes bacterium]|nr:hypothetical protein [Planctomycetota bacterium]
SPGGSRRSARHSKSGTSMPLPCPVCKAENDAGPACRRCKADLTMLFTIEEQRAQTLGDAQRSFAAGKYTEAYTSARHANELRPGPDVARWLAVLHLIHGHFGEAWQAYQTTCQHG